MPPRKSKKEASRLKSEAARTPSAGDGLDDDDNFVAHAGNSERRPDQYDEEEEEDDDEDDAMGLGVTSARAGANGMAGLSVGGENGAINGVMAADLEREKMNLLLANFNEDQMSRYEAFRRANINRNGVKKLANAILNQSITPNVAVALSGMSKVFVGEVVERARDIQLRMNPPQSFEEYENRGAVPLKPEHLREAWRMMKLEAGTVPNAHWRRQGNADGMFFR
ncbi:Taf11p [Sugiyamaella lignohabitans]|uniref:Transcription initiation factor TFIID subunit 11 n=1 Tax=Sugiyamaella lignohabitans TaxID=796027 RepID=A0A161HF12_9ASCO|nr:Taf11p [Sugiyamaella lignohabitans]ANB14010.1 Taf11p [Sugiyamaella lignohabitans]